jgi:hypothetical protein
MGDGATDDRGSIWHLPRSLLQPLKVGNAVHTVRVDRISTIHPINGRDEAAYLFKPSRGGNSSAMA